MNHLEEDHKGRRRNTLGSLRILPSGGRISRSGNSRTGRRRIGTHHGEKTTRLSQACWGLFENIGRAKSKVKGESDSEKSGGESKMNKSVTVRKRKRKTKIRRRHGSR